MVQCSFTSTETRRLVMTDSPAAGTATSTQSQLLPNYVVKLSEMKRYKPVNGRRRVRSAASWSVIEKAQNKNKTVQKLIQMKKSNQ